MARLLGPEGVGEITLFASVTGFVGGLLSLSSSEATLVFVTKALTENNKDLASHLIRFFYRIDFLLSILTFTIVALLSLVVPKYLKIPAGDEWLQVVYGLTLVFQSTYWISHALLRVANRFSWTFLHSIAHSLIKLAGVALLYYVKSGLGQFVFLLVLLSLLDGVSIYILAQIAIKKQQLYTEQGLSLPWWKIPREVWRFEGINFGRNSIKVFYNYLDVLMIGYLQNPLSVGYYRAAKQVADLVNSSGNAVVASIAPEYTRLWFSGDFARLKRLAGRIAVLLCGGITIIIVASIFFLDPAIRLLFGEAFLPAKPIMLILMAAALVVVAINPINNLLASIGKVGYSMAANLLGVILQTILLMLLAPIFGIVGAAWAKCAAVITMQLFMLPFTIKHLNTVNRMENKDEIC